jgi:hypothetical protein
MADTSFRRRPEPKVCMRFGIATDLGTGLRRCDGLADGGKQ